MRTLALLTAIGMALSACNSSSQSRSSDAQSSPDTQAVADGVGNTDGSDGQSSLDATSATDGGTATDAMTSGDSVDGADQSDGVDWLDSTNGLDGVDGATGTSTGVDSPLVDPSCVDGQWSEALPPNSASLSQAINSYSPTGYMEFILQALSIRYPTGQWIVEGGLESDAFGNTNCIDAFLGSKSTSGAVIDRMSTLVHECGHFFDLDQGGFVNSAYMLTESVQSTCSGGGYQGQNATFARSLITTDEFSALRPPCDGNFVPGCDSYADIYLDGDPTDSTFDSGDQGFNMLHEETTQYVNSLATGYAFADQYQFTVSERDGILTFLWYTCRYLRMARLQYPGTYSVLTQDACWREAILRVWGRAWLFLEATKDMQQLGISDDSIESLLTDELLSEIQLVREAHGCGG